jgi:hypothetical protein
MTIKTRADDIVVTGDCLITWNHHFNRSNKPYRMNWGYTKYDYPKWRKALYGIYEDISLENWYGEYSLYLVLV